MPTGFFDKLNTLVKSHINDLISPIDEKTSKSRRKALSRQDIRRGLQDDVRTLRQRIEDAMAYEERLQGKVDQLYQQIADLDRQADQAVEAGREADARLLLGRMQQSQRELEMMEADLREHRLVTQELISQVNALDGAVYEAEQQSKAEVKEEPETEADKLVDRIGHQLDDTRQKMSDLITHYTQPEMKQAETPAAPEAETGQAPVHPVDKRRVDDDYSARLARLSKPDDKKK
jgi:phage shock protein A